MLILTRKVGQSIVINSNIEVKVLGVTGMQVRLGIEAPPEIPVDRMEKHQAKQAQQAADQEHREKEEAKQPIPFMLAKQAD